MKGKQLLTDLFADGSEDLDACLHEFQAHRVQGWLPLLQDTHSNPEQVLVQAQILHTKR